MIVCAACRIARAIPFISVACCLVNVCGLNDRHILAHISNIEYIRIVVGVTFLLLPAELCDTRASIVDCYDNVIKIESTEIVFQEPAVHILRSTDSHVAVLHLKCRQYLAAVCLLIIRHTVRSCKALRSIIHEAHIYVNRYTFAGSS